MREENSFVYTKYLKIDNKFYFLRVELEQFYIYQKDVLIKHQMIKITITVGYKQVILGKIELGT